MFASMMDVLPNGFRKIQAALLPAWLKAGGYLPVALAALGAYAFHQMGAQSTWWVFGRLVLGLSVLLLPAMATIGFIRGAWGQPGRGWQWGIGLLGLLGFPLLVLGLGWEVNDLMGGHPILEGDSLGNQHGLWNWLLFASLIMCLQQLQHGFGWGRFFPGGLPRWRPWVVAVWLILLGGIMALWSNNRFQIPLEGLEFWAACLLFLYSLIQLCLAYLPYFAFYYLHHHLLFNKLLRQKGLLYYLAGLLIVLIVGSPLLASWASLFPALRVYILHPIAMVPGPFEAAHFVLPLSILAASLPIIVLIEWYKQSNRLNQLNLAHKQAELSLLKQQINPHFFFNTLNNLYAMSLTQAKETPETILKLADLMRYVIYKGQNEMVELKEDWQYVQDYIDLQQIRLKESVAVKLAVSVENWRFSLPPLMLIMLIENAFKHGIEPAETTATLSLALSQQGGELHFHCQNSLPDTSAHSEEGIGLDNLKRRLELRFPDSHSLDLEQTADHFSAQLKLSV